MKMKMRYAPVPSCARAMVPAMAAALLASASTSATVTGQDWNPRRRFSLDLGWKHKIFQKPGTYWDTTPFDFPVADWDTVASPQYNDSAWRSVDLPHDFIVEGRFNGTKVDPKLDSATGYLPLGVGWYRRTWRIPSAAAAAVVAAAAAGRAPLATLTFDGVFRNCTVCRLT